MGAYNSLRKQSTASSINGQLENHCSAGHLATLCPQDSPIPPPSLFSIPSVSSEFQEDHSTKCPVFHRSPQVSLGGALRTGLLVSRGALGLLKPAADGPKGTPWCAQPAPFLADPRGALMRTQSLPLGGRKQLGWSWEGTGNQQAPQRVCLA